MLHPLAAHGCPRLPWLSDLAVMLLKRVPRWRAHHPLGPPAVSVCPAAERMSEIVRAVLTGAGQGARLLQDGQGELGMHPGAHGLCWRSCVRCQHAGTAAAAPPPAACKH
eukprot:1161886-Pelagomonas_calceolata.AAC.7